MSSLLGIVCHHGELPSDRVVGRMRTACVDPGRVAWGRDPRARLGSFRGPAAVIETDEVIAVLDGWLAFPQRDEAPSRSADAATLLEGWKRWGVDLVRYVEGEFSAVVFERASGVLHLIRDAAGTRPIYWARGAGCLAFASHAPALLELPWVSRSLAREHLAEYLAFRVVHAPRTLLTDVRQLPAGHRLRYADGTARVIRHHEPTYAAPGTAVPREQDVVPELSAAVEQAVRRRLSDARPVGVYLSGGVGSTALVAAARSASRTLKTYTVAFAEEPFPESPFAGRVASLLGMEHTTVAVASKDVADRFDDAVQVMGHPVGNVSTVLQLLLAEAAAKDVSVVLTGDGTDQLFGGNMLQGPAAGIRRAERLHRLPGPMRQVAKQGLGLLGRGRTLGIDPDDWALAHGVGGVHLFDARERRSLLLDPSLAHPDVRTRVLGPMYDEVETDRLNAVLHAFYTSTLVADTLPRVTATATAAGLEPGFPLLDREVRRLAQVLPGSFKVGGVHQTDLPTRWLLRTALSGTVPSALVNRPDRGLPRPLDDWLTGAGRLFLDTRFAQLRADPLDLFHTTSLEALRRGLGRTAGAAQRMWALLILDAWLRLVKAT